MSNKPLIKFQGEKRKGISVTIWPGKNGGYAITLQKTYKDKTKDEWKTTNSYFPDELEELIIVCGKACDWMADQKKDKKEVDSDNVPF